MGKAKAKKDTVSRHDLRHDRHTVSLLTDHLVFSPKYRGKVLDGEVAEAAEEVIRETCRELDIEVIDKPFFIKESFTKETIISRSVFDDIGIVLRMAKRIKEKEVSKKWSWEKKILGNALQ